MTNPRGYKGLALGLKGDTINLGTNITTAITTGLTKGDMWLAWSASFPKLGICTSTATQKIKYFRIGTVTLGSTSID